MAPPCFSLKSLLLWMELCPPQIHLWKPCPSIPHNMVLFGDGAFGSELGLDEDVRGRASNCGAIHVLLRRETREVAFSSSYTHVGKAK